MQVLQDKVDPAILTITIARPGDARQVAKLYRNVYGNDYPSPELFTEKGMTEFLAFEQSHCLTTILKLGEKVIAAGTFFIQGHTALARGWMVDPAWQSKINARQFFRQITLEVQQHLAGKVDYVYGEVRTATAKMQAIVEGLGWHPCGTLPFKDAFGDGREAEILYVGYCHKPQPGRLRLTPRAAEVASVVLKQRVSPVRMFVPPFDEVPDADFHIEYVEEPNGEGRLHLRLPSGASLAASLCPAPRNSDRVAIRAPDIADYVTLLRRYLTELEDRGIEYTEVCVHADAPARQKVLEDLGFSPTGFLPGWYAPGEDRRADCVFYTIHFPSHLPEVTRVELTPRAEILRPFITPACLDASHMFPAPYSGTKFSSWRGSKKEVKT